MSIRTRSGDKGYTKLIKAGSLKKDSHEFVALGDIDELIAYLGLISIRLKNKDSKDIAGKLRQLVSDIASSVALNIDGGTASGKFTGKNVRWIEEILEKMENSLPARTGFYYPGKNELSAYIDITRAVARRAERSVVGLYHKSDNKNPHILKFMNSVSDLLFLMMLREDRKKAGGSK
ncbi:MAG: cob(I)yrinic acid a,c-diamide adenosyltransferase [Candidatus Omnitrophica bacterium]|nr:cob(I)yrinic acid a,c-diamide adenosyltransferase [Candidatus Omnitrophota bacterium]